MRIIDIRYGVSKIVMIILSLFTLLSCVNEDVCPTKKPGRITINLGPDTNVSSFRIMAFDVNDRHIVSNVYYSGTISESIAHLINVGIYNFVFVANEPAGTVHNLLERVDHQDNLNSILIPSSAFSSAVNIPMTLSVPNVTVLDNDAGVVIGGTTFTEWEVTLQRLAVRFDMVLKSITDITSNFSGIRFYNLPDNVPLVGTYSGLHATERSFTLAGDPTFFQDTIIDGFAWAKKVTRVILPSNEFVPTNQLERLVGFSFLMNDSSNPGCTFGLDEENGNYTMPHNTNFIANVTVKSGLEVNLDVMPWAKVDIEGGAGSRRLDVSSIDVFASDRGISRVYFWSDQSSVIINPTGYEGESGNTSFNVNDLFTDLSGAGASNFTYNPGTGQGYFDLHTKLTSESNNTSRIYLNANGLVREIRVNTIVGPAVSWQTLPYVGTFHRWNETGERIISGDNTGPWSVSIEDPSGAGNFIVLSSSKSFDPNLNTEYAGNAESYQVTDGSKATINGTGPIYFRMGLTSKLASSTTAPRYARLVVTTTSGTSYLYVRQGEEADYIHLPTDPVPGLGSEFNPGGLANRPNAVKWSPYNLTVPGLTYMDAGNYSKNLGTRGYSFTNYPTQRGFFFQFYSSIAYMLSETAYPGFGSALVTDFWSARPEWETCPAGYHRVNDGATDAIVDGFYNFQVSEMFQSLVQGGDYKTPNSTALGGCYADGFFDRRLVVSPVVPLSRANSKVSAGATAAYSGILVYNSFDSTHRSLFFPGGGFVSSGNLLYEGDMVTLLNSASSGTNNTWLFRATITNIASNTNFSTGNASKATGGNIRCVKD